MIKKSIGKIVNKFKANVKNNGDKNQNIVNSPGAILINHSVGEEIQRLIRTGRISEGIALLKQAMDGTSAQHPAYPHWRYDIDVTDGKVTLSHVPNTPDAMKTHPLRGSMKLLLNEEVTSKFRNWNELLRFSYEKQMHFEFDALSFETWVGDKFIERFEDTDGTKKFKVRISPKEFPPPAPMRLYVLDSSISYDYLEIGLKEIDGDWLVMDNNKQANSPVFIEIKINPLSREASLNITLQEEYVTSAKAQLQFNKFLLEAKNKQFALKFLKFDTDLFVAEKWNINIPDEKWTLQLIRFLSDIVDIENFYGVQFNLIDEITEEDEDAIYILKNAMNGDPVKGTFSHFSMQIDNVESARNLVKLAEENPDGNILSFVFKEPCINLLGERIYFVESEITCNATKVKNLSKLKRKVENMESGDSITVYFIPASKEKNKIREVYTVAKAVK